MIKTTGEKEDKIKDENSHHLLNKLRERRKKRTQ